MATSYTSLLGLALPVTGELGGTWGDTVNNSITSLLDTAIAGTTTLSTDADVTLSTTTGASNQARQAILLCSGARTALRTITAPAQSKIYAVVNNTSGGYAVKIVGAGPTTGVTVANGKTAIVIWNGSDFVEVAPATATNLSGGAAGSVPYQSGANTTTFLSIGTAAQVLQVNAGATAPEWVSSTGTGNVVRAASPTLTGTVAGASLQLSSLTSGRVTYAGASGLLQDSANLLYSGTDLTVYGVTVGRGAGAVVSNTAVGASALAANTTGTLNTAVGASALAAVSTAANNTAVGYQAATLTNANSNTAIGHQTLWANTSGAVNVAVGSQAMYSNIDGGNNTAVGALALYSNTSGTNMVAIGRQALYSNTTTGVSTAVGYQSQFYQTGGGNESLGLNSLRGASGLSTGTLSVAIGRESLYSSTSGYQNTALGYQAGYAVTSGGINTFLGYSSGSAVTSGAYNVILGAYTGNSGGLDIRTASNNIVLSDGQANIRQYYLGASNAWVWLTGASERMRIDSSGNVGIGTSSPASSLDVAGAGRFTSDGSSVGVYLTGALRHTGTGGFYIDANTGGAASTINFRNGSGFTAQMTIDASGNVGIGTSSPDYQLHLGGQTVAAVNGSLGLGDISGKPSALIQGYREAGDFSGALLLSTTTDAGTVTERLRITSAGNVGIGTSSPGATLDVTGTARISSNLTLTGGTANGVAYLNASKVVTAGTTLTFDGTDLQNKGKVISGGVSVGNGYFQLNRTDATNLGSIQWITSGDEMRYSNNNGGIHTWYVGSERMRITAAGNVGIGTTSPVTSLVVSNAGAEGMEVSATGGLAQITAVNRSTLAYATQRITCASFVVQTGTSPTTIFQIDSSGAATMAGAGTFAVTGSGTLGYGTGSGGTVTQGTSRTQGVTLDKTNGAITLVSAAGTTTWQSFTVTNNKVAATDTVIVNQKSGTDLYMIHVTAVAAGSFRITFATTGGTTTEQPVFNFAVIKAVTS